MTKMAIFENSKWRTDTILKNSFVSIYQPWIFGFRLNLVQRCEFPFRGWTFDKKSIFCKFKMADGRHIENRILAVTRRHIGRLMQNLDQRWRITCRNGNFRKFKMAGDCHFENSFFHILAIHYPISIKFGMQFQWTYENSKYYIEKLLSLSVFV